MVNYKDLGLVNSRNMFKKAIDGGFAIPGVQKQILLLFSKFQKVQENMQIRHCFVIWHVEQLRWQEKI